jgi:hypothetical protein
MHITAADRDVFFTFTPRVSVGTPGFALDDDVDEDEDDDDESELDDDDDEESDEDDEDEDEDEDEPETWQVLSDRQIPLKHGGA